MTCPEDADCTPIDYRCNAECITQDGTFMCTRPRGHTGNHHCHRGCGICLLEWNEQVDKYFFCKGEYIDKHIVQTMIEGIAEHFKYSGRGIAPYSNRIPSSRLRCVRNLEVIIKG